LVAALTNTPAGPNAVTTARVSLPHSRRASSTRFRKETPGPPLSVSVARVRVGQRLDNLGFGEIPEFFLGLNYSHHTDESSFYSLLLILQGAPNSSRHPSGFACTFVRESANSAEPKRLNEILLSQKISDAGPFSQRIDPHILIPARSAGPAGHPPADS
jgi:hypothetical protein